MASDEVSPVALSFANNFWGRDDAGVSPLIDRMLASKQTCDELRLFYSMRASIEEEYGRKLLALSRKALGTHEIGNLKISLDVTRGEMESMAKQHQNIAAQMKTELEEPLAAFAGAMKERRKIVQTGIEKLLKVKIQQTQQMNKARDRYEQECLKIKGYLAQGHMVMGQEERRNKAKLEKTQLSLAASNTEYKNSVKALEDTTFRWNREWKSAADKFQDLEEERLDFTKSSLWQLANISSTVCVSDDASCEKIRLSLEGMDIEQDIAIFIKELGTGQEIPDPPKYINFCRGDPNGAMTDISTENDSYSMAQFPRDINPAFRTSSPQPSTYESHHDPNSTLANNLSHRGQHFAMITANAPVLNHDHGLASTLISCTAAPGAVRNTLSADCEQRSAVLQQHLTPYKHGGPIIPPQTPTSTFSNISDNEDNGIFSVPHDYHTSFSPDHRANSQMPLTQPALLDRTITSANDLDHRKQIGVYQPYDRGVHALTSISALGNNGRPTTATSPSSSHLTGPHANRQINGPVSATQTNPAHGKNTYPLNIMNDAYEVPPEKKNSYLGFTTTVGMGGEHFKSSDSCQTLAEYNNPLEHTSTPPKFIKKSHVRTQACTTSQDNHSHISKAQILDSHNNSLLRRKSAKELTNKSSISSVDRSKNHEYTSATAMIAPEGVFQARGGSVEKDITIAEGRSLSPDLIDPNASLALNVGPNIFTVKPSNFNDKPSASPAHDDSDPIVKALAKLKGDDKSSLSAVSRMSADQYHGISTPITTPCGHNEKSVGDRISQASDTIDSLVETTSTPPPSYQHAPNPVVLASTSTVLTSPFPLLTAPHELVDTNRTPNSMPIQRLGVPPPAVTSKAMREASRKVADQSRNIFGPTVTASNALSNFDSRVNDVTGSARPTARPTGRSMSPHQLLTGATNQRGPAPVSTKLDPQGNSSTSRLFYENSGSKREHRPGTSNSSRPVSPYMALAQTESVRKRSRSIADPSRQYTHDGHPILHFARAMYTYRAAIPQELGFAKGDILAVSAHQDDGWWQAELQSTTTPGQVGLVPSNYLQPC